MRIILKQLVSGCGITLKELGAMVSKTEGQAYSKSAMFALLNKGIIPCTDNDYKTKLIKALMDTEGVSKWLKDHKLNQGDVWNKIGVSNIKKANKMEVAMLTNKAKVHFGITFDPLSRVITDEADVFTKGEMNFIRLSLLEAAMNNGFQAIIGPIGSGKTIALGWLELMLAKDDKVRMVLPCTLDKRKLTVSSLLDALIYDLSTEAPKSGPEKKARQAFRILRSLTKENVKTVLVIDEAHDLTVQLMRILKRLHEVTYGMKKTIAIILIGQPELGDLLNNESNTMQEVSLRMHQAQIKGLGGGIKEYVHFKFRRSGLDASKFFTDDSFQAMGARMVENRAGRKVSTAAPLVVNNTCVSAMNYAADHGEKIVTADVIHELR